MLNIKVVGSGCASCEKLEQLCRDVVNDNNIEAEIEKLESELKYTKGFLIGVDKKLSNERFVNNAPEDVVAKEKQKKSDAEARIRVIEDQLLALNK